MADKSHKYQEWKNADIETKFMFWQCLQQNFEVANPSHNEYDSSHLDSDRRHHMSHNKFHDSQEYSSKNASSSKNMN